MNHNSSDKTSITNNNDHNKKPKLHEAPAKSKIGEEKMLEEDEVSLTMTAKHVSMHNTNNQQPMLLQKWLSACEREHLVHRQKQHVVYQSIHIFS